ncbi:RTA1 domain-containing protein [Microdochium nivale]|nr:RTA1 domain-containing protein [Microdochium nivale]
MQSPASSSLPMLLLYGYRPSLALSLSLAALYSVLFAAASSFLVAAVARRRHRGRRQSSSQQQQRARARAAAAWVPYTACLAVACLLELAGYICRVDGWEQRRRPSGGGDGDDDAGWSDAFKAQLLLLVIAPVFVTAALALGLEQLTASLADEQPATTAAAAAGKKVDGKKHSRILLPLCAVTLLLQAVGAALSGQAQSENALAMMILQQQQQIGSSDTGGGGGGSISTGDMVVITGLVLQLNCLCVLGYRFLAVIWRQGSSQPGGAGMLRNMELDNASSGWRRRLLQSQRGGQSHRDDEPSMPEAPAPAVASQHTQVPYAIAEEHDAQHIPEGLSRPPPRPPVVQPRRRLGRGFLYAALVAATILVIARTAFRVVEFSQPSWRRSNNTTNTATTTTTTTATTTTATAETAATSELLFALFDTTLVALATLLLLAAHPLLTLVSDPSPPVPAASLQNYDANGAGGAERYRRIQDWVETLTLSGGGGGGGGGSGGNDRSSTLGRSMSRRFSWVASSRRTGRSGQLQQQQREEEASVAAPERAVIPMYR